MDIKQEMTTIKGETIDTPVNVGLPKSLADLVSEFDKSYRELFNSKIGKKHIVVFVMIHGQEFTQGVVKGMKQKINLLKNI